MMSHYRGRRGISLAIGLQSVGSHYQGSRPEGSGSTMSVGEAAAAIADATTERTAEEAAVMEVAVKKKP
jgi:hypothetical protein